MSRLFQILGFSIGAIMAIVVGVTFVAPLEEIYSGQSASYLVDASPIKYKASISFIVAYFVVFFLRSKLGRVGCFLMLLFVSLWLLSGRLVAYKSWPNPVMFVGWYFIPTDEINLTDGGIEVGGENRECEFLRPAEYWTLEVPESNRARIFVGPFQWNDVIELVNDQ